MAYYYVNDNAQSNGDHEVHVTGCTYLRLVFQFRAQEDAR